MELTEKEKDQWYASWFNTPFYHILYKDRDYQEASMFMKTLTSFLNIPKNAEILDLACGRGRHSRFLNTMGFEVTGVDLSPLNIAIAKNYETQGLHFEIHDMRLPYPERFDAVFNLFTSFGYFENEADNLKTIKAIKSELKPDGFGVIDFLNAQYVEKNLVAVETKIVEGITFRIERFFENDHFYKNIKFIQNNKEHFYTEKVKALTLTNFENYFKEANVTLRHCFGDYHLRDFNTESSQRLILIFN